MIPRAVPVLLGATAVGKTAVSLPLAEALGAEIVSVDSRQIFRGMEIGSAAPTPEERARVPHHFVAECAPDDGVSAGEFGRMVERRIAEIRERGRAALLVGGSGLYLRAALGGLDESLDRDPAVREKLRARLVAEGAEVLHRELAAVDPATAAGVSPRDGQRVTRALEIHATTGRRPSDLRTLGRRTRRPAVIAVLDRDGDELAARIRARAMTMIGAGLVEEVRALLERGVTRETPALRSIGYAETIDYLEGGCDRAEWIERIVVGTRRLVKRQRTWFRSIPEARWFHVPYAEAPEATAARVLAHLRGTDEGSGGIA